MVSDWKRIQVSLTDEEHAGLKRLAAKRDITVSDLIRQAIRQVYISELEQDLGVQDVRRVDDRTLLIAEGEEEIGIEGPEVLAQRGGEIAGPRSAEPT